MKFVKIAVVSLLLMCAGTSTANAAIYYVDTAGSNSNDGLSTTTPWQTLAKLTSTTFAAGDTILLKRGQTFTGTLQFANESGTSGNPITLGAYSTGSDPIINSSGSARGLDFRNSASYFNVSDIDVRNASTSGIFLFTGTFTNLHFTNVDIASSTNGFEVNTGSTTGAVFDTVTVASTTGTAMLFGLSASDTFTNVTISGPTATGVSLNNAATTTGLTINGLTIGATTASSHSLVMRRLSGASVSNVSITDSGASAIFMQSSIVSSTFNNITLTNPASYGIRHDGFTNNWSISSTTVTGAGADGIKISGGGASISLSNITSSNNEGGPGLRYAGASDGALTVSDSTFNNNGSISTLENGIGLTGAGNATTTNTTAKFNANDGFNVSGSSGIRAVFISTHSEGNGIDGQNSDGDGYSWHGNTSGYVTKSFVKNNKKGGVTNINTSNVDVYNNIFVHDTTGTLPTIVMYDTAQSMIYNNTLYNPSGQGTGILIRDSASSTVVNNIVKGFQTGVSSTTNGHFEEHHNVVNGASVANFSGITPSVTSSTDDPAFLDENAEDFYLTSTSPAIDNGYASLCPTLDYDGNTRKGACDIGALEYDLQEPIAGFDVNITDLDVDFTDTSTDPDGTIESWVWDFGDGSTSTTQSPSYSYASEGTYTVELQVTDNNGQQDTFSDSVTVSEPVTPNQDPTAGFTYDVDGLNVDFTDTSFDPDGDIVEWQWDFGDGNNSSTQHPSHTYFEGGIYTVVLTVIDDQGGEDSYSDSVTIDNPNEVPEANFEGIVDELTVNFTDLSDDLDGEIVSWQWDFGDGNNSNSQNPSHTYNEPGDYLVELLVTDDDGGEDMYSDTITVSISNQNPTAGFTTVIDELTVDFTDTSDDPDGSIAYWFWDFGDGATSTASNPSHTYATDGTYTVELIVTDDQDAEDTFSDSVTVAEGVTPNQDPTAGFSKSITNLAVQFTDTSSDSDGTVMSWLWDFGDSGTSMSQSPSHTYTAAGTYTVELEVTDNDGGQDTFSDSVTVTAASGGGSSHSSGGGGGGGSRKYGCKDPLASNYQKSVTHRQSLCKYSSSTTGNTGTPNTGSTGTTGSTGSTSTVIPPTSPIVTILVRDLTLGSVGEDVRMLQKLLNTNGYIVAQTGPGSLGQETTLFGNLTLAALRAYQRSHAIVPPAGYFGPLTRTTMKQQGMFGTIWW